MPDVIDTVANAIRSTLPPELRADAHQLAVAINYWVWRNLGNPGVGTTDPYAILAERAGQCGERSILSCYLLDRLGIETRTVSIFNYYSTGDVLGGHTMFEAKINGQWALFDPLIGAFFTDDGTAAGRILSMAEIVDTATGKYLNHFVPFNNGTADQHSARQFGPDDPNWTMPRFYTPGMLTTNFGIDNADKISSGFVADFNFVENGLGGRWIHQASLKNGVWAPLEWDSGQIAIPADGIRLGEAGANWSVQDAADVDTNVNQLSTYSNLAQGMVLNFGSAGQYKVILWPTVHTHLTFPVDIVKLAPGDNVWPIGSTSTLLKHVDVPTGQALVFDVNVGAGGLSIAIRPDTDLPNAAMYVDALQVLRMGSGASTFDNYRYADFRHQVNGTVSRDFLQGGAGDDQLIGRGADDHIIGGGGTDIAVYSGTRTNYLIGRFSDGSLRVEDRRAGSPDGTDVTSGVERLVFADGHVLSYNGQWRPDLALIEGTSRHETLLGLDGKDNIFGYAGNDRLYGLAGDDSISAGSGDDLIRGGLGIDYLAGGSGADRFEYAFASESRAATRDVVLDFSRAQRDKIDVHLMDANTDVAGDQIFTFVGNRPFSGAAGELRYAVVSEQTVVQGNTDSDAAVEFEVRVNGIIPNQIGDFIL
jgi:Ca2+-binding RTX toxin-like protein